MGKGVWNMPETKRCVGITVGPISDTLMLTSSPAGLWGASYLMSEVSRMLCILLREEIKLTLVSPYYDEADPVLQERRGIGLFPDHLIFEMGEADFEEILPVIEKVKNRAADLLCPEGKSADQVVRAFVHDYLQIHVVAFESGGNAILDSAHLLDAIELERSFPCVEKENPILSCLDVPRKLDGDTTHGRNAAIKSSNLVRKTVQEGCWQLLKKDGTIRNTQDIAGNDIPFQDRAKEQRFKKYSYYAIVQTDGDNMSKTIERCGNDGIRGFSKRCLMYASAGAEAVREYGGVTIYAGGDDLLFIAPVENEQGKNLFDLLQTIREKFEAQFLAGEEAPTLSFGIAICYYKYPLYEAFGLALQMLFGKAKKTEGKNALALTLQKHSGKSVELLFPGINHNACWSELKELIKSLQAKDAQEKLLNSAVTHLRQFEVLFANAARLWEAGWEDAVIDNVFKNVFDVEVHDRIDMSGYLTRVRKLFKLADQCVTEKMEAPSELDAETRKVLPRLRAMDGMLRLVKFFFEKGQEEYETVGDASAT
jgi:CRISPR-associated protein Cmr2